MEWEHGRQLKSVTYGNVTTRYQYNADGIRIKKTLSNGTWHEFHVMGGTIIGETRYNANGTVALWMRYNMDADGSIYGISTWYLGDSSWTDYYFVKNLQGDVIQVRKASDNSVVASYTYDAWGNVLSESGTLAHINRFRYRGYYYDEESSLYYLQSRYYDPALGRFINADAFASTGQGVLGNNMFAYCLNNPVRYADSSGHAVYDCFDETDERSTPFDDIGPRGGGGAGSNGVKSTYVSGVTKYSNGGNGTGSMIGDAAYQDAKAAATTPIPTYTWGDLLSELMSLLSGTSSSQCFVAGTLVHTQTGAIAIEEIRPGDYVWAWDEETGDVALKEVVETYVNETFELVHIFVNGEEIITTPAHPFYSPVKGWLDAVKLRAGDNLVLVNGEYVVVEKVQHEIFEAPITVYNFQVKDYHTYFVADTGLLVHNDCAKKRDIQQINKAAQEAGIPPEYRYDFGDYVEDSKLGMKKDFTYPYKDLLGLAEEFKEEWDIK